MRLRLFDPEFRPQWLLTQALCLAIAGFLALAGSRFWPSVVYSLLIGNLSALFIDIGRHRLASWRLSRPGPYPPGLDKGWPGWPLMAPVVLFGGLAGYFGGAMIGDALTGYRSALPGGGSWRGWTAVLTLSVVATLLATWFFYSRNRLAAAETRIAQVGLLAAEAQLKLIESQLEPHMLFNTLANLRALIGVDPERAQAMLDRLIAFLRATLSASRAPLHPLAAEFARLGDYLALMQIRMGERLSVEFDLPGPLAGLPVPPLLLQPLVENAIQHGLEPQRGPGRLRISARRAGERLVLEVSDNGCGCADAAASTSGGGFGLTQVRARLAAVYGEKAGLGLAAAVPRGTTATVDLPWPGHPGQEVAS